MNINEIWLDVIMEELDRLAFGLNENETIKSGQDND